jgi:hypothetical protein
VSPSKTEILSARLSEMLMSIYKRGDGSPALSPCSKWLNSQQPSEPELRGFFSKILPSKNGDFGVPLLYSNSVLPYGTAYIYSLSGSVSNAYFCR